MKRLRAAFFFFLFLPAVEAQAAPAPFPFAEGTRWTYTTNEGSEVVLLVEGHSKIETPAGSLTAAVVRRSDGADRLVFRTESEWIECGLSKTPNPSAQCSRPLVFFRWPLTIGDRWKSGNVDLVVTGREDVQLPWKKFEGAWRIAYVTAGGTDPIGEMWVAENVGRLRIIEGNVSYELKDFLLGKGAPLASASAAVVATLLRGSTSNRRPSWKWFMNLFGHVDRSWILIFMALLIGTSSLLYVGLGLRKAIEAKTVEEDLPSPLSGDPIKLMSALAVGGNLTQVRRNFIELLEKHPKYADLHYQHALVLEADGEFLQALEEFEEAIRLNAGYVDARLALGNLLIHTGEGARAIEQFRAVTAAKPEYADGHLGLGRALLLAGQIDEASTSLENALRINPRLKVAQDLLTECRKNSQTKPHENNKTT